jgi:hypothetical protein
VYCKRCYSIFKEEKELEVHQRSYLACGIKPQELDGLTSSQVELLKPRDRSGSSEEERWKTIYKICFPDDKNIPSPCKKHRMQCYIGMLTFSSDYGQYWEKAAVKESVRKEVLENIWRKTKSPKLVQCVNGAFNSRALRTLSNTCDGTTRDEYQMASSASQHSRQTPTSSYVAEPKTRIASREQETDLGIGFLDCSSQCLGLHGTFDSVNNGFSGFENDNSQFRSFSGTFKPTEDDGLFGDENDYSQFPDASATYKPPGDVFTGYHNDNALPEHMPELYGQCDRDSGDTSMGVFGSDDSNQTLVDVYEFKDLDMEGTSLE